MLKYLGIKEGSVPLIGCYNECILNNKWEVI